MEYDTHGVTIAWWTDYINSIQTTSAHKTVTCMMFLAARPRKAENAQTYIHPTNQNQKYIILKQIDSSLQCYNTVVGEIVVEKN